jgi:hypothetical protein
VVQARGVLADERGGGAHQVARQALGQVVAVGVAVQVGGDPLGGQQHLGHRVAQRPQQARREAGPGQRLQRRGQAAVAQDHRVQARAPGPLQQVGVGQVLFQVAVQGAAGVGQGVVVGQPVEHDLPQL